MADFAEKTLVLYYYPKDSTPGCTTEANGFSASIEEFEKKNVTIIGVSGDNAKSHCNFIEKQGLKFKLATDEVTHLTAKLSRLGSLMCPSYIFLDKKSNLFFRNLALEASLASLQRQNVKLS